MSLSRFLGVPALPDGLVTVWAVGTIFVLGALSTVRPEARSGTNLWKEAVEEFGSGYNLSGLLKGTERLTSIFVINAVLFFVGQATNIDVGALQSWSLIYSYALPTLSVGIAVFLQRGCDLSVTYHSEATLFLESLLSLLSLAYTCFHLGRRVGRDGKWWVYVAYFLVGAPVFRSFLLMDPVTFLEYRFVLERLLRRLSPSNFIDSLSVAFSSFSSLWLNLDGSNPLGARWSAWTLQHPSCVKSYGVAFLLVKAGLVFPFVALGLAYAAGWRLSYLALRMGGGGGGGRRLGSAAPAPAPTSEPAAAAAGGGGGARRRVGTVLILLCLFAVKGERLGLSEYRVSVGHFPISAAPSSLAVLALNGVATVFASFEGWSADEAINGFMLTSGLGITEETRSKVKEFEPAIKEYLSRSRKSASRTPITLDEDSIALPVVLAGEYHLLQCSRFDDFRQVSQKLLSERAPRFLSGVVEGPSESTNVTELIAAQLSVRARMLAKQHEAFADDGQGAVREQQSTCPVVAASKSTTTSHLAAGDANRESKSFVVMKPKKRMKACSHDT